jgi:hypothetical protein
MRVEQAAKTILAEHAPWQPSIVQLEDGFLPLVNELKAMPEAEATAYIHDSYTHVGHQALVVRMFIGQPA